MPELARWVRRCGCKVTRIGESEQKRLVVDVACDQHADVKFFDRYGDPEVDAEYEARRAQRPRGTVNFYRDEEFWAWRVEDENGEALSESSQLYNTDVDAYKAFSDQDDLNLEWLVEGEPVPEDTDA